MKVTLFNTFSDSKSVDISSLPKWKQVFINYTTWSGHYKYNNTLYACSLGLITADQYVKVSFVDRNTHIDLLGILFVDRNTHIDLLGILFVDRNTHIDLLGILFVDRNTHIDLLGILFFFIIFYLYTYFKS
jgi:hypothetical protein